MKKGLLVLGMITCLLGLTACGGTDDFAQLSELSQEDMMSAQIADTYIAQVAQISEEGMADQYVAYDPGLETVFANWKTAMEGFGAYSQSTGYKISGDSDNVIVQVNIESTVNDSKGEPKTATAEVIFTADEKMLTGLTVNENYSMSELMTNAGLNTILGMGTVFCILILICGIIYLFAFIPKIEAMFSKKEKKADETKTAVDSTIAQIIENEELSDDSELVAVISAAVAAYEAQAGTVSGDGFVVRSIRRANTSKWQRA